MSPRPAPRMCHHRSTTVRRMKPNMEVLELRALLSRTSIGQPTFVIGPLAGAGPGGGFTPAQMETGYGFSSISFNGIAGTGSGETIAIVDAYNDPNIQSDLNTFDTEFGLPATTVSVVNETGGTSLSGEPIRRAVGSSRSRSTSSGRTPWRPGRASCWSRPAPTSDTDLLAGRQIRGAAMRTSCR